MKYIILKRYDLLFIVLDYIGIHFKLTVHRALQINIPIYIYIY